MTLTMSGQTRFLAMLVLAIAVGTPAEPLRADQTPTERIDLPTLVELVVCNDPALEALHRAIAVADFKVAVASRGRDPEIRARYAERATGSLRQRRFLQRVVYGQT